MSENKTRKSSVEKFLNKIDEADIRSMVYLPPIVSFLGFLIWFFIMDWATQGKINPLSFDIALFPIMLILCFTGFAQIRKKETPVGLRIIHGNLAIINGIGIILLFGSFGIFILWHAVSSIFFN